jgi:hypothetical protein
MDSMQKAIAEALEPLSPEEARQAINTAKIYVGDPGSPNHKFALSLVAAKEAALRNAHDAEMLSIARKSLIINASKKKRWYETPFGMLVLGIVASLLAWLILRFFGIA